ncbi:AGT2-like protein [Mya arenaria]|uniref:Alanine--glyoxylate aminotransferase 2, mitochondrial n=1 Tax=Mya arenaria TaxID=6604 RepID=A0ABY7EXS2_MYAAR|nr:AGT2-like protein [Mya arenaria]
MKRGALLTKRILQYAGRQQHKCGCSVSTMPPCDFKPDPYTGISFEDAVKVRKNNLSPALFTYYRSPLMIHQGYMQWLFDHTGRRYLDLFGGIVTVSVGHCHPKVNAAAERQLKKLWHTTNIYMHPKIHEYAQKLASKLPENLKVVYFVNSGSEANDLAVHMARMHTGTYEVVSLRNAYHGASPHLMGLTAISTWRFNVPSGFGIHQTMNADPFRGPWGGKNCRDSPSQTIRDCDCAAGECKAGDMYYEQLEDVLRFSMPKGRCGAFFAESIQGVGGTVQYPKNFLKRAFAKVRESGGICISDEVQTGFVVMAKGMGNGFPLGAVVTTPEIAAGMGKALHFNTYGGNPVASAVGSAEFEKLRDQVEIVGDVRGKGLMIGVEMVTDKASRAPLGGDKMGDIWEHTKDLGILMGKGGFFGNVFRIKPPMCITKADADFTIAVFKEALEKSNFD